MPTRQRMVNKPWPYKAQALRLHELDDDVLSLIVAALAHESLRSLQAFALVSGRFLNLCAPLLFREITWTGAGAVPHGVAVQTRLLHIVIQTPSPESAKADWSALEVSIPLMTLLREVSLDVNTTVPQSLWNILLLLPNLRTIRVRGFPTFTLPEKGPSNLTRLLIGVGDVKVAGADRLASSVSPSPEARDNSVSALLVNHAPSLEEVKLPAQLLAASLPPTSFLAMRKLTLTGTLPSDVSIPDLLQGTPNLRELSILLTLSPGNEYGPSLFPHGASLRALIPHLRALALSNLNTDDGILDDPPAMLEVLDLVSVARTDGVTRGMRLEHSFAVVGALAVAGTDLRDLRLFTRAQPPVELAEAIVRAFPRLHTLQLGIDMYRPSRPAYTPVWAEFAEVLAPLRALRRLYLGLDLPVGVHVEDYAEFFCRRLPALEVVGMQALLGAAGLRVHSPSAVPAPSQAGWVWAPRVEWSCSHVTRVGEGEFEHRYGTYVPLAGVF